MDWKEYTVVTEGQCVEAVAGIFHNLGCGGVSIVPQHPEVGQIVDGIVETTDNPGYKEHDLILVKAYFPQERDILNELKISLQLVEENFAVCSRLILGEVKEEDWEEAWKKYYHCFKIGERLVIKPSWEDYDPQPGEMVIELDPGMAFGTGSHISTQFCLRFIDQQIKGGEKIIDIGCGSGILAIAAAKLGAAQVLAMDIDELAVKIARKNVTMNGLEAIVSVTVRDITQDPVDYKADYILANITAEVVYHVIPPAAKLLADGAYLFCAGIIDSRWFLVKEQLEEYGFAIRQVWQENEWMGITAQKK